MNKKEKRACLNELCTLLKVKESQVSALRGDSLENVLQQLKEFDTAKKRKISGTRPEEPPMGQSGVHYEYKEKLAAYIKENTEIALPVSAIINVKLYEAVANYCKLP